MVTTTLVTLAQTQRVGVFQTPSATVPLNATGEIQAVLIMDLVDIGDATLSVIIRIYRFDAGQGIWRSFWTQTWRGDPSLVGNPRVDFPPRLAVNASQVVGETVRAEIEIPVRMKVGASIDNVV